MKNAQGVDWTEEQFLTAKAKRLGLANVIVWRVRMPHGYETRIITEDKDGRREAVFEATGMDDVGCHLDIMAMIRTRWG